MRIGVIADTHGCADAPLLAALRGCARIIHAGDVGPGVLERLRELAPLTAVRGNTDRRGEPAALPAIAWLEAEGFRIAVVHREEDAPPDGWEVLVVGHTHRAKAAERDGRLILNPGAAGRRGPHRERTAAILELQAGRKPGVTFVTLGPRTPALTEVRR